jgi:predicted peroxiredoxin
MEKVIHKLINEFTEGVDTYTHNGSTWLIFTDTKQWVIELTEEKTLWYNYNFFKGMFAYTSMDVVENQHYITKWVEDNIINKVKDTILERNITEGEVEEIIENGVKETSCNVMMFLSMKVEDTIQNGVKHTITSENRSRLTAENIIENGVKLTNKSLQTDGSCVIEDTIQNGVRHTEIGWHQCNNIDDAIEKGVKEIYDYKGHRWDVKDVIQDGVRDISPMTQYTDWQVEEIIENGVKDTRYGYGTRQTEIEDSIENGVKKTGPIQHKYMVEDIIENGELKTSSRNLEQFGQGYSLWKTETVINEGVKETKEMDEWVNTPRIVGDVIENGVKETLNTEYMPQVMVEDTIKNGVKETNYDTDNYTDDVNEVIREGVKETKTPGKDGDIMSTVEWMNENNSSSYTKMIDDVIENGVKETKVCHYTDPKTNLVHVRWPDEIDDIVENGEKINGTYAGGQRQSIKCKSVVEYGTKNPTD